MTARVRARALDWRTLAVVALGVVVLLVVELALPAPAAAISLNPADWVVDGFKAILNFIFGDVGELGGHLINLLLGLPLLTDEGNFPRLNHYREYVTWGAYGILPLTVFLAFLRYWLAGYSGGGAMEALVGVARAGAALGILLVFPVAFDQVFRAVNAMTAALVENPVVGGGLGQGMVKLLNGASFAEGGIMLFVTVAAVVMAFFLLFVKVIIIALLAVLYVASPLAIALWPVDELAWVMRSVLQAILGVLAFPIIWALCFSTFAVLSVDALFPGDHGDTINAVLAPMIGLASMILAYTLPLAALKQAMRAGVMPGGSRAVAVVRMMSGRRGGGGARPRVPSRGAGAQ